MTTSCGQRWATSDGTSHECILDRRHDDRTHQCDCGAWL